MADIIRQSAKEILGVSTGKYKELWRWNEEVRKKINDKYKRFKELMAVGLDNISIEVWKCLVAKGIQWLSNLFNIIWRSID